MRRTASGDVWDVGCGTGTLLASMNDRWNKHGIEPGGRAVAEARRQGFDVRQGTAVTCGLSDVADVVLLVDVIEHMPEPSRSWQRLCGCCGLGARWPCSPGAPMPSFLVWQDPCGTICTASAM